MYLSAHAAKNHTAVEIAVHRRHYKTQFLKDPVCNFNYCELLRNDLIVTQNRDPITR